MANRIVYLQIKQKMIKNIENGVWSEKIPSEPVLVNIFKASRETVRKALMELVGEGYIYKIKGKGTFINHSKQLNPLSYFLSLSKETEKSDIILENTILEQGFISCQTISSELIKKDFNHVKTIYHVARSRSIEGEPFAFEYSYFNAEYLENIEKEDFSNSIYDILKETYMVHMTKVSNRFYAASEKEPSDRKAIQYLNSHNIILIDRIIYSGHFIPLYGLKFYVRTDHIPLVYEIFL